MAQYGERTAEFSDRMSDAEALMWNVEQDPWLNSTMGTVVLTDRPIDTERLRRRVAAAAAGIERLRDRVVPHPTRLGPPSWQPDPEFDLDHHVRRVALPAPADRAELFALAARLIEDPFDRTRPLWQFIVVEGLADGGGALIVKLHHSVTDGVGAIKLAEQYMDLTRDSAPAPEVDLDAVVAADLTARRAGEHAAAGGGAGAAGPVDGGAGGWADLVGSLLDGAGQALKAPSGIARRLAGDALLAMADPTRLAERGEAALEAVRGGLAQLDPGGPGARSPLWGRRSRRRMLRGLEVDLPALKAAATAAGVSLNDAFVAGAALAAGEYHRQLQLPLDEVVATFVVSTRHGGEVAGNAFSPAKALLPTGPAGGDDPAGDRAALVGHLTAVHAVLAARKAEVSQGAGLLGALAGAVNLLPHTVVARLARAQAMGIDFATSNVRAAPIPVYIAGGEVLALYPLGPVVGTAWNVTMMSYCRTLFLGVHLDPVAVAEPDRLMACLADAYRRIIATLEPAASLEPAAPATRRRRSGTGGVGPGRR